jgi:hypothetical protein
LSANPCFASPYDFLIADPDHCPLAWNGITLYGRFDYGLGYDSYGVPFNGSYPNEVQALISKNSNGARFTLVPNGRGQSHIGIKGVEPIASDWSLVFKFENGFAPYTPQRASGPKSLVENNTTPVDAPLQHFARIPHRGRTVSFRGPLSVWRLRPGNGSNSACSLWMTGDFGSLTFGVEADKNKDAVSYSNFAQFPLPPGVSANSLKATLSSNTSGVLGVRYTFGNAALYSGWKYILFANPSDAYPDGFYRDWQLPRPSRLCAPIEKLIYFGGDGRASGIARPSAGGRRASLPTRGYSSGESRPNSPAWRGAPLRQSVDELEVVRLDGGGRAPCVVNQSRCDKFQVRRMKRV